MVFVPPLVKNRNEIVGKRRRTCEAGRWMVPVCLRRHHKIHDADFQRAEVTVKSGAIIAWVYHAQHTAKKTSHFTVAPNALNGSKGIKRCACSACVYEPILKAWRPAIQRDRKAYFQLRAKIQPVFV